MSRKNRRRPSLKIEDAARNLMESFFPPKRLNERAERHRGRQGGIGTEEERKKGRAPSKERFSSP